LYYRLNVIELAVPPLELRPQDILPLARHFLSMTANREDADGPAFDVEAEAALLCHDWAGNVRELQNRIQRASLTAVGPEITARDLDLVPASREAPRSRPDLPATGPDAAERRRVEQALVEAEGVVSKAADNLGLSRQALYRKMERLGIVLERRPR
jgi:DNA-binding NtrC family response regulator